MPLNAANMGTEIKAAIEGAYGPANDPAMLSGFCNAIATAVVNHIKTNGTITFAPGDIPVSVSTGSGVGANTAGAPLTGKIS